MSSIDFSQSQDKLFKIKKLQYSTYDIVHPTIQGQFRMIVIPQNFVQLQRALNVKGLPQIGVGSQTIVGFSSTGKKMTPTNQNVTPEMLSDDKNEDITTFVENSNEPWNEFSLEGNLLIRLKSVMTKLIWIKNSVNVRGDPSLWANSIINLEVFENKTGDTGLQ